MSSIFGDKVKLSTWGESHGSAIGGVIDGFPPLVCVDIDVINQDLQRRKDGIRGLSTARKEREDIEFLSGIKDGVTLGTPIAFLVRNSDVRSSDYDALSEVYRPSHADYTYQVKYGIRDHRGGGRASARETVARVVAGSLAKQYLHQKGITIAAYSQQIGCEADKSGATLTVKQVEEKRDVIGAISEEASKRMFTELEAAKNIGDSVGGIVRCIIDGVPIGLGEPVFDKLEAKLAHAMLSIPACKGFDYGSGFRLVEKKGSCLNDEMINKDGKIMAVTNYSGGILGGISNGEQIDFRVVFKPIASIAKEQNTVNHSGDNVKVKVHGRHDVSVFPRVLPIVESMAALVLINELI